MNTSNEEYYYDPILVEVAEALAKADRWVMGEETYSVLAVPNPDAMRYWRLAHTAVMAVERYYQQGSIEQDDRVADTDLQAAGEFSLTLSDDITFRKTDSLWLDECWTLERLHTTTAAAGTIEEWTQVCLSALGGLRDGFRRVGCYPSNRHDLTCFYSPRNSDGVDDYFLLSPDDIKSILSLLESAKASS